MGVIGARLAFCAGPDPDDGDGPSYGAFRPKTKHKESADIQIIERPSHCGNSFEGPECSP